MIKAIYVYILIYTPLANYYSIRVKEKNLFIVRPNRAVKIPKFALITIMYVIVKVNIICCKYTRKGTNLFVKISLKCSVTQ